MTHVPVFNTSQLLLAYGTLVNDSGQYLKSATTITAQNLPWNAAT